MLIAKLDTKGKLACYPYSLTELQREHRNTSFPDRPDAETLRTYNLVIVEPTPRPEVTYKEDVVEAEPVQHSENEWHQDWKVVKRKKAEVTATEKLMRRQVEDTAKRLLSDSDWTQLADVNLSNDADWIAYRATLRKIMNDPTIGQEYPPIPEAVWLS